MPIATHAAGGPERILLIRPERVRLVSVGESPAGVNVVPARVVAVAYLGEDLEVQLEVAGAGRLQATTKAGTLSPAVVSGAAVSAWVRPADLHVLPPRAR